MLAWLWQPFTDYHFMLNALLASVALALSCPPLGVFLVLRRMSLIGDAMAHAIFPGIAIAYLIAGLSYTAMVLGGLLAGIGVALLSGWIARRSVIREDTSFATLYLLSLAVGVTLISLKGSQLDLFHVLFGSVLGIDDQRLRGLGGVASLTLIALALIYRPLVIECFDSAYFRQLRAGGGLWQGLYLGLVALNLVAAFQALGTLLAVALMILPAATAQCWSKRLPWLLGLAVFSALLASVSGLLLSYHFDLPGGPAIVLCSGLLYLLSLAASLRGALPLNAIGVNYAPPPH